MENKNKGLLDVISSFTGLFSPKKEENKTQTPPPPPAKEDLPIYQKDKATIEFLRRHEELKNKIIGK